MGPTEWRHAICFFTVHDSFTWHLPRDFVFDQVHLKSPEQSTRRVGGREWIPFLCGDENSCLCEALLQGNRHGCCAAHARNDCGRSAVIREATSPTESVVHRFEDCPRSLAIELEPEKIATSIRREVLEDADVG